MSLLEINDLHINFKTYGGEVQAVRGVNLKLEKGETLAIVGESGCGKSVTAQSIMRLLPKGISKVKQGEVWFNGTNLLTLSDKKMRKIQGNDISMIFQDPMTSLNPTLSIGTQLTEGIRKHTSISASAAKAKALEMLTIVGISNGEDRLKQYPHEFSGGMRQRLMIAMALICEPDILIADEPTTALDVTIQAQILSLFKEIQRKTGVAIILITHDLGVVAQLADRVHVMYAGKVIELSDRRGLFYQSAHPYTKGLLRSIPRLDDAKEELVPISGTPPDLFSPPTGCPFAARCHYAMDVCRHHMPEMTKVSETHQAACWLLDERSKQVFKELA
ncbi:ABC transporter ATP-binding protein [Shouchella sp. JSM 1781072]|uniref:ABC transporter ATP-binding protein n=1 Tax=Bacillaceae TaxID=186817 RepID=UPI0020D1B64E|nr:ABC transporter ATP-binding protein [Alkalihalobacillus sp. LMS6]UTR05757.1 ABC transporter ATP-binding protein [Alkalihalobacillus sp. LMS6]